jgi:hypothetical protein
MGDFHPDAQVNGAFGLNLMALMCSKTSEVFLAVFLLKIIAQNY